MAWPPLHDRISSEVSDHDLCTNLHRSGRLQHDEWCKVVRLPRRTHNFKVATAFEEELLEDELILYMYGLTGQTTFAKRTDTG